MAHFRATIQGNRGSASRLGSKSSGLTVKANGWKSGVTVEAVHDSKTDTDVFNVFATTGSNPNHIGKQFVGQVTGAKFIPVKNIKS